MVVILETKAEDDKFYEYRSSLQSVLKMDTRILGVFETLPLYKKQSSNVLRFVKTEGFYLRKKDRLTLPYYEK